MMIRAPEEPGLYKLKYDMVAEQCVWFEAAGSTAVTHALKGFGTVEQIPPVDSGTV